MGRQRGETYGQWRIREGKASRNVTQQGGDPIAARGGDSFENDNAGLRKTLSDAGDAIMGTNRYKATKRTLQVNPEDQQRQLEMRGEQGEQNQWLKNAMLGKGPSVAEQQLRAGGARAQNAAASQAATARGGNIALANRFAAQGQAQAMADTSRDAGILRASEQQAYAQQYTGALQAQRLADLQARGMTIEEAKAQLDAEVASQRMNVDIAEGNAGRGQKGVGSLASAAAMLFASDIAAKEDVQAISPQSLGADRARREEEHRRKNEALNRPKQAEPEGGGMGDALSTFGAMMSDFTQKELGGVLTEADREAAAQMAPEPQAPSSGRFADLSPRERRLARVMELQKELGGVLTEADREHAEKQLPARTEEERPGSGRFAELGGALTEADREHARESLPTTAERRPDAPRERLAQALAKSYGGTLTEADMQAARDRVPSSHAAYAPVDAVSYRYRPEAAERMADESPARTEEERDFVYADKRAPRAGIIAQQLERSPAFRPAVVDTPAGKAVVRDRALSTALAQGADLDKRLRELEARKKRERAPVEGP